MKAIVCEMCTSNDVVKQDGYYVCQSCGTKYTIEEAKKLLVEVAGKVDVSGSRITVDNSDAIKRSLENARRAFQKEDWDETEKYYNLVEQNDPSNIEAIFYSAYAKAKGTLVDEDIYRRESVFNSFAKSISIIDDNFNVEKEKELRPLVDQMYDDIIKMSLSQFVYTVKKNGYGMVTGSNEKETYKLFLKVQSEFADSVKNIGLKLKGKDNEAATHYYLIAKKMVDFMDPSKSAVVTNLAQKAKFNSEAVKEIGDALKDFDPENAKACYKQALERLKESTKSGVSKSETDWYNSRLNAICNSLKEIDPDFDDSAETKVLNEKVNEGISKNRNGCIIAVLVLLAIAVIIGVVIGLLSTR